MYTEPPELSSAKSLITILFLVYCQRELEFNRTRNGLRRSAKK